MTRAWRESAEWEQQPIFLIISYLHFMQFRLLFPVLCLWVSLMQAQGPQTGKASYYADHFKGRKTASGEKYDPQKYSAAHRTLPFGTWLKVTNTKNDKSVAVRVNDRGPFVQGRIVDLSRIAAEEIGMIAAGTATVRIEVVDSAVFFQHADTVRSDSADLLFPSFVRVVSLLPDPAEWCVDAGVFTQADSLLATGAGLEKELREVVMIMKVTDHGEDIYHLLVSQYPTAAEAEAVRLKLADRFPSSKVVQYNSFLRKP
jgi:rare lipoprotein A